MCGSCRSGGGSGGSGGGGGGVGSVVEFICLKLIHYIVPKVEEKGEYISIVHTNTYVLADCIETKTTHRYVNNDSNNATTVINQMNVTGIVINICFSIRFVGE